MIDAGWNAGATVVDDVVLEPAVVLVLLELLELLELLVLLAAVELVVLLAAVELVVVEATVVEVEVDDVDDVATGHVWAAPTADEPVSHTTPPIARIIATSNRTCFAITYLPPASRPRRPLWCAGRSARP
ncbi:MAG: hypothetical protein H0W70_07720 [Actinobacteria bacterium]|nr:hypothetical protein [Actinomycetota bacterium]